MHQKPQNGNRKFLGDVSDKPPLPPSGQPKAKRAMKKKILPEGPNTGQSLNKLQLAGDARREMAGIRFSLSGSSGAITSDGTRCGTSPLGLFSTLMGGYPSDAEASPAHLLQRHYICRVSFFRFLCGIRVQSKTLKLFRSVCILSVHRYIYTVLYMWGCVCVCVHSPMSKVQPLP